MTEYSGIRGTRVKYLSSDPTLNTSTEGQVWYNSTEGTLKSLVQIKAWSSGGSMGTARYKISSANAAPQDAALGFGGGPSASSATEEYSGFSWSNGGNLNTATRGAVGAGTQTAGLRAGGFDGGPAEQDDTEEYDGTSWTSGNNMPANMRLGAGCGTQTAGLAFGGFSSPTTQTVEYDGTNWAVGGNMNTGRYYLAGFGIQTAAVAAGGDSKDDTEEYNGTSWTSVNDVTSGNTEGAAAGGILTAGLFFGGTRTSVPAITNIALDYDGTNWSTTASMGTARYALGGTSGGSNTAGLAFGGNVPPLSAATEEYNSNINAITQAAWASGGNLTTGRMYLAGCGTQTAGLAVGGATTPFPSTSRDETEEYNGSSWSEQNNLTTARKYLAGCGTQTAGLAFGGSTPYSNLTEEYNGSSWTAGGALSTARNNLAGFGIQTAGVAVGGYD
jgi:hypothetical protein